MLAVGSTLFSRLCLLGCSSGLSGLCLFGNLHSLLARQDKTRHDKTIHDKTRQDTTRQDKLVVHVGPKLS